MGLGGLNCHRTVDFVKQASDQSAQPYHRVWLLEDDRLGAVTRTKSLGQDRG